MFVARAGTDLSQIDVDLLIGSEGGVLPEDVRIRAAGKHIKLVGRTRERRSESTPIRPDPTIRTVEIIENTRRGESGRA